jgi:hypothetical protein
MIAAVLLMLAPPVFCDSAKLVFSYGDSKTYMYSLTTAGSDNKDGWQVWLQRELGCRISFNVYGGPGTTAGQGWLATNGIKTSQRKASVDADLLLVSAPRDPDYLLYNLGSNDCFYNEARPEDEATLKANTLYIWDAFHAKWPTTTILYSVSWRHDYDACSSLMGGWLAEIAATRDFVGQCDDETQWVAGTDDGATMFWDGVHYSIAGVREKVRLTKACLGL